MNKAMREASNRRTVTDTDSRAFAFNHTIVSEGKTVLFSHIVRYQNVITMFDSYSFNREGKKECARLGNYFQQIYAPTPAEVECGYVFGDYVVEITENGNLVNQFIAYPDADGLIGTLRVKGMNLEIYFTRFQRDHKVLWFDADDYEADGWGEYIDFSITH